MLDDGHATPATCICHPAKMSLTSVHTNYHTIFPYNHTDILGVSVLSPTPHNTNGRTTLRYKFKAASPTSGPSVPSRKFP